MIGAIYSDPSFVVSDSCVTSTSYVRHNSISQGCPLSPFPLVILMTVLLSDAKSSMSRQDAASMPVSEAVYADNTLLVGVDADYLHDFMTCVGNAGQEYGLTFNRSKLELLPVRTSATICTPDGSAIKAKSSMVYLGSSLSSDGRATTELNRRLGLARADFDSLSRIWAHSTIGRRKKLRIFDACVISKLRYGLSVATLSRSDNRRLDGFHARCLRKIVGIPPSFISRVSNVVVFDVARAVPLSVLLRRERLIYMGQIARRPAKDPVRNMVFKPGCLELRLSLAERRRGRPRQEWNTMVLNDSLLVAGSAEELKCFFSAAEGSAAQWKLRVNQHMF